MSVRKTFYEPLDEAFQEMIGCTTNKLLESVSFKWLAWFTPSATYCTRLTLQPLALPVGSVREITYEQIKRL